MHIRRFECACAPQERLEKSGGGGGGCTIWLVILLLSTVLAGDHCSKGMTESWLSDMHFPDARGRKVCNIQG